MSNTLKIFLFSIICLFCFASCDKEVKEEKPVEYFDEKDILASPPFNGFVYKFEKFQNPDAWKGPSYTLEERFELCQVPKKELSRLSVEGMAISAMFHPMSGFFAAYIPERKWFDIMIPNSNLLTELSKRPNGAGYLLKVYNNMRVPSEGIGDIDRYSLDINDKCLYLDHGYLALLLSADVFCNQLSPDGCKFLAEIAFDKFVEQFKYPEYYSWASYKYHLIASASALLRIEDLDLTDEEREYLTYFVNVSGDINPSEMVPVVEMIQSHINTISPRF